ncbi:MAG: CocE/NonD family hydrolase [Acidimicrobiales bacterium]
MARRRAAARGSMSAAALAAITLLGLGAQAVPAPANATEAAYVTTSDPVTPVTVTDNVPITMSDGVVLESDEYVPTDGCPCPVILVQTPYRKEGTQSPETIPYLYDHGYAEIVVDVRGTGSSGGMWDSFGPREQQDGAELALWAAKQPFSDGSVGLAGVSYSGINQLLTVEQLAADGYSGAADPVKAIFPIVPMSDAYRDVTWAGGNIDSGFIPLWLGLVDGLALEPADNFQSQPQIALNTESQHALDLAQFTAPVVADAALGQYEGLLPASAQTFPNQSYDGSFYQVRSPIDRIGSVDVPTFIVGGTWDLFQRGEPLLYNGINLPTTEKKLLIGPWYHVTEGTGLTNDDGTSPVSDTAGNVIPSQDNLMLGWFDRWLKGTANGIDTFPTVETYRLGADQWVPDTRFPATGTTGQRWYMVAGGGLSPWTGASGTAMLPALGANGVCSRSTWQWTAGIPTEAPLPSQATTCETDSQFTQAQGVTFTSAPFTSPYTVSGPIEADIYMSSTGSDSTVEATVSDVAPGGTPSDVTAGTLVASMRALTTAPCGTPVVLDCSVYLDGQMIQPWHPYTPASQTPLTSGHVYLLRIEIFPTSATFEPGHSMRITITTSDAPHEGVTLSTGVGSIGVDTFYVGGPYPSSVYLGAVG